MTNGKEIYIEKAKFKMCNLDTLIHLNDQLNRIETATEGFIKKIDRLYLDILEKTEN